MLADAAPLADDAWQPRSTNDANEANAGFGRSAEPVAGDDPLRLRRARAFPATVDRLHIRLKPMTSFASMAQAKRCGQLYGQLRGNGPPMSAFGNGAQVMPGTEPAGSRTLVESLIAHDCIE